MVYYQELLASFLATLGAYTLFKIVSFIYNDWRSPLNDLPGPRISSLVYGNLKELWEDESALHERWSLMYGSTWKYHEFLGISRLYTTDVKAVNHIIMNDHIYQKAEGSRYALSLLLGNGILTVEGVKHRQQRRVMNPAFGPTQIRELSEIFIEKSIELRDALSAEIESERNEGRVDILAWLGKTALDIIGLAGFNYEFNSLNGRKSDLFSAFSDSFKASAKLEVVPIIRMLVPGLRFLPANGDYSRKVAKQTMMKIGNQLLQDSKSRILDEQGKNKGPEVEVGKDAIKGRDLLSLLVRANLSTDLHPNQRMSDEDVLAQVPTFIVAGHETTSTGTAWALFFLSRHPKLQVKLREELITIGTDNPTFDELNSLQYLDAVLRETLRVCPPVPSSMRTALKDDIIPLGELVKDRNGKFIDHVRICKGQAVVIPIVALNTMKSVWGEDAQEFSPGRWKSVPEEANAIPGVWGNQMTFLGGPHACIGYRFSIAEMKSLLFTLVRAFEFELAVPVDDISKASGVVQRPYLKSDPEAGNQLPLIIRPFGSED